MDTIANVEMAKAWDGEDGEDWTAFSTSRSARSVRCSSPTATPPSATSAGLCARGGRLAILAWRRLEENAWLVALRRALAAGRDLPSPPVGGPGPFGLADVDGASASLAGAGFHDVVFTPIDEPMFLGTDAEGAYAFVRTMGFFRGMTSGLDDSTRAEAVAKLRAMLAEHETPEGVLLASGAWLITESR